jgi:hypothetical protein
MVKMVEIEYLKGPKAGQIASKFEIPAEILVKSGVARYKEKKSEGETKELKPVKKTKYGRKGSN